MKQQNKILTLCALQQASAFFSAVPKRAPTCLKSTYNPVSDARPQTGTYLDNLGQSGPDMGYAVRRS